MTTLRPLGVGSQILTHGDKMAGFYGEVNGIITANELRSMVGVTQGTPMQTGDITWLKFSHNYKTLYIAKQPIQHSISWDYLHERDLVFGKMVEIGGNVYLLRLMQGSNIYPANTTGGYNSEVEKLIQNSIYLEWKIYNGLELGFIDSNTFEWCQEVYYNNINNRLVVGGASSNAQTGLGGDKLSRWRPVLELLY